MVLFSSGAVSVARGRSLRPRRGHLQRNRLCDVHPCGLGPAYAGPPTSGFRSRPRSNPSMPLVWGNGTLFSGGISPRSKAPSCISTVSSIFGARRPSSLSRQPPPGDESCSLRRRSSPFYVLNGKDSFNATAGPWGGTSSCLTTCISSFARDLHAIDRSQQRSGSGRSGRLAESIRSRAAEFPRGRRAFSTAYFVLKRKSANPGRMSGKIRSAPVWRKSPRSGRSRVQSISKPPDQARCRWPRGGRIRCRWSRVRGTEAATGPPGPALLASLQLFFRVCQRRAGGRRVFFSSGAVSVARGRSLRPRRGHLQQKGCATSIPAASVPRTRDHLQPATGKRGSTTFQNSAVPGVRAKGMTSRMLPTPVTNISRRSNPRPKPAWGTVP